MPGGPLPPLPAPRVLNGNPLRWWNRARWWLGVVPFERCPNGNHAVRNIYGDEINLARARSRCEHCTVRWHGLDATGGEV